MRVKPYRKRKPYKRKKGGGKYMLRGNSPLKSLPTKDLILAQFITALGMLTRGKR